MCLKIELPPKPGPGFREEPLQTPNLNQAQSFASKSNLLCRLSHIDFIRPRFECVGGAEKIEGVATNKKVTGANQSTSSCKYPKMGGKLQKA